MDKNYDVQAIILTAFISRRRIVAIFTDFIPLQDLKKFKKLEFMYQNAIYIYIT